MNEHEVSLKNDLKYLLNNENYWNVMMFCKDGTMAHNRLTAGLIFPQLQDEISVICPDFTMQDITDQINKLLYFGEVVENKRDKICASHVLDSDARHFVQDLGFAENEYNGKMFANNELPNQEINLDVSFDLDLSLEGNNKDLSLSPLDQLCLDLAPFNQKSKDKENTKKNTTVLDKSQFPLSSTPIKDIPHVPQPQDISTNLITDKNLDLENSFDTAMRKLHSDVTQLTETCIEEEDTFQEETSEDIAVGVINLILDNINYDNFQKDNRGLPCRSDSMDSIASTSTIAPQPSNLIFSTLGSFRQAEEDEPIIRLTAYESQLGFETSQFSPLKTPLSPLFEDYTPPVNYDNSYEYIEEKPDVSMLGPFISDTNDINCRVDIERMILRADDWKVIHMYLEQADEYDIKAKFKNQTKRENSTIVFEKPKSLIEKKKDNFKPRRIPFKRPKRINRCFKCENCKMTDCRKCSHCKDMKKYGGRGTKKQSCMERKKCIQYSQFEFKNKNRQPQDNKEHTGNTITLEKVSDDDDDDENVDADADEDDDYIAPDADEDEDEDYIAQTSLMKYKRKRKLKKLKEREQEEIEEKKRKVREIKERFKKQEAALKEGKNPLLSVLTRDELLFGFHL